MKQTYEWRTIPSTNGTHEVSEYGDIRKTKSGLVRSPSVNMWGYKCLRLRLNGTPKMVGVHTLVAEAFIGPRPAGMEVNHKDGNKLNNRPGNLEYVTSGENQRHSYALGLREPTRGELNGKNLLTEEKVREIYKIRSELGYGARRIAKMIGLPDHPSAVGKVLSGHVWKHVAEVST